MHRLHVSSQQQTTLTDQVVKMWELKWKYSEASEINGYVTRLGKGHLIAL